LLRKVGGPIAPLSPLDRRSVEGRGEMLASPIAVEATALADQLRERARGGAGIEEMYAFAHELRGLAATVGLAGAGRIAGALCTLIERSRTEPSRDLVVLLVEATHTAARSPATSGAAAEACVGLVQSALAKR
jgi:hypothetical protein